MNKETIGALTPSQKRPSGRQIVKICDRLTAAIRKTKILTSEQVQVALKEPGTFLEKELQMAVVRSYRKVMGIVTAVEASKTGLVPSGWKIKIDKPEGDISLIGVNFFSPTEQDEISIDEKTMLLRTSECIGSLGLAEQLLKKQEAGEEIFPQEFRGKNYIILPRTILIGCLRGESCTPYFCWDAPLGLWTLGFQWLKNGVDSRARFMRLSAAA